MRLSANFYVFKHTSVTQQPPATSIWLSLKTNTGTLTHSAIHHSSRFSVFLTSQTPTHSPPVIHSPSLRPHIELRTSISFFFFVSPCKQTSANTTAFRYTTTDARFFIGHSLLPPRILNFVSIILIAVPCKQTDTPSPSAPTLSFQLTQ